MHFKGYKINRICLVLLLDILFTKAILVLQIPLYLIISGFCVSISKNLNMFINVVILCDG